MKATIWLRIAAVLTLVHAALHTLGGVYGPTPPGPASVARAAMEANRFPFLGPMRSFWDFHMGMGLAVTIFLTVEAVVFWLLASPLKREGAALRPVLAMFALGYMAFAAVSMVYFFPFAAAMEVGIAICLVGAMTSARTATSPLRA
ncbi:MAG TPA: hypothetical protein VLZ50_12520 [Terracidiphilus sp.]|nr:hypothetical protein [Terracidiphilus sp.]